MNEKVLARAERVFGTPADRHEKGSAMTLIQKESDATREKSARLKALRMAQAAEETAAAAPAKREPKKTMKRGRS
ncbi:hypothetical protein [Jiella avicenniae]|uniref:Uncharacterized protein n=1 Tax=Jiella avicenniae TaxID=2907202 RepID=A0A9X1T5S3_9HYPH|nr:hypothetical protein [Jiella avicenniae]MCE7029154.1 hypothetical protein [Jiella avicenniae]